MITLKDVHKSFGSNHVLRGINLTLAEGESLAVIGGSGTGKSVLSKCILGLMQPDSGVIEVDGAPQINLDDCGVLFQGGALFDSLRVWENVAFRPLQQGLDKDAARALAINKLARVGLKAETAELFPAELSGGMQKRAGLARAIAGDPKMLFFDEPTAGLDPIKGGMINRLIREIVTEGRATALTISHDIRTVETVADRVAMIHDGQIFWEGPVSELHDPDNAHVYQFVTGLAEGPIDPLA